MTELVREDNYALSRSYKFTYDNGGNIVRKETYYITEGTIADTPTRTDTYDYETVTSGYGQNAAWKDQLKSYNGTAILYDESGNPLNYLGKVMTWRGRKLTSIDGIAMDYDYNGLRVRKGDKTYYWQSGNLIMERWVKNGEENYIYYYYDESGVCGMNYNGTEYYYRKNILGDVIAIYDSFGNLHCRYVYDAWGNHKVYNASGSEIGAEVINIGNVNSIRYRGYYWDKEFNLYYLQSRYYDSMLGRFVSADDINYLDPESIIGLNLYAYCGNNPIMYTDPEGHSWESFWNGIGGKIVGTVLVAGAILALSIATAGVGTAVVGALGGGFGAAVAGGAVGGAISGAIVGTGISMISQGVTNGYSNIDYGKVAIEGLIGMASGAMTGALFAGLGRGLGLLGKTKWAQRTLKNFDNASKNFMFGSKSGNFTFFRNGKSFRLESSLQHGLHYHSLGAGTTAAQWEGIFKFANIIAGLIGGSVGNALY